MTRFPRWMDPDYRAEWYHVDRFFRTREDLIVAVMVLRERLRRAEARGERERGVTGIKGEE